MQLLKTYPPQVKEWKHMPKENFEDTLEAPVEEYILEITPPEPADKDLIYFNVTIQKKIINSVWRSVPFSANVYYHFKVKSNNEAPTAEFYYSLIESAALNFAIYFFENTKKTNLKGYKIQKVKFDLLKDDIEKAIDTWKRQSKYIS